jgi:hypothetical protein
MNRQGATVRSAIRIAAVLAVAMATVSLSGCTFMTQQETRDIKDVVTGANADVGDVDVRNAIALTETGRSASLSMTVLNDASHSVDVRFSYPSASGRVTQSVALAANSILFRGTRPGDEQMLLMDVDIRPGALLRVFVDSGGSEGKTLEVPVLNGALPQYSNLLPAPGSTNPVEPGDQSSSLD